MAKKKEKINFKYNISVYYRLLVKYKWIFIVLLFFSLVVEASYVADKFLFKVIIDNGTEFIGGTLARAGFINILFIVLFVFFGVLAARALAKWLNIHLLNKLDANLVFDLKRKFFNHIIGLSHSFHVTHKTGSMISRITRGGRAIERITDTIIFDVTSLIFQLIVVSLSLIYFDLFSAVIILLIGVVFILYSFLFQNLSQGANIRANNAEDIEKANIGDIFTNIDSIKYFGKEDIIKKKFTNLSENTRAAMLKHWDYYRWVDGGQALILGIGTFFIIYFPLMNFLDGGISLGTLTFIYTVYVGIVGNFFGFVHALREFYRVMADFEALFEYGKIKNEVKDRPNAEELKIKEGEIEFSNVGFRYGKRKIFSHFNLEIPKKKKIALVGHSGSGKTTLVKLLYRLYDVNSGAILIDERDIEEFNQESLRAEMSIVPQECILFDDSVYNNVTFSNPKASRKEVLQAMKFAQLDKVVKEFPKKENTIVGERGVKLSGGEKQRVSIARAILANKKVLVLDEATSSLDSETEAEIQKDLAKLMKGRTSIIIAHRLSTIMKADMIVVLKKGEIVQKGKHNQLIKQEGEYRKLWNLQKGGYIK